MSARPTSATQPWRRLLRVTGMPVDAAMRFPTEFSGGQQQRIGIARALALQPKLLVCDEPVSALDVSVQAQILNLLRDLQKQFKLTYLFISHNIAVTAFMSQRIGVMYLGRLVEIGPSREIVNAPLHPYTMALINAVPDPEPGQRGRKRSLSGDVPSPINRPSGCPFHPRCPWAQAICKTDLPPLREIVPASLRPATSPSRASPRSTWMAASAARSPNRRRPSRHGKELRWVVISWDACWASSACCWPSRPSPSS